MTNRAAKIEELETLIANLHSELDAMSNREFRSERGQVRHDLLIRYTAQLKALESAPVEARSEVFASMSTEALLAQREDAELAKSRPSYATPSGQRQLNQEQGLIDAELARRTPKGLDSVETSVEDQPANPLPIFSADHEAEEYEDEDEAEEYEAETAQAVRKLIIRTARRNIKRWNAWLAGLTVGSHGHTTTLTVIAEWQDRIDRAAELATYPTRHNLDWLTIA